ncbi:MAG: ABC transporter permease [Chloroherpetonaceae bacterium]|nr:ABC transporter permease [Chthonomonadaceae bacterium]MDW8206438.1 ABC transporter permease [Chloroherpetonaceae bacterium]
MTLLDSIQIALRGLISNKLRTALTMLGIIIGVAVVIIVVAIGQGATKNVTEAVNSLGTNILTVRPDRPRLRITAAITKAMQDADTARQLQAASPNRLTLQDARLIARNFPRTVAAVAPQVRTGGQVRLGNTDASTNITGTTVEYTFVTNTETTYGRFFTDYEQEGSLKVCVVGRTVAEKLTGNPDADLTGQTILLNRQNFTVVGMMAPKGATAWGQDQDDVVIVPITTAMRRLANRQSIDIISVRCVSERMMPLAQEQIATFLRNRHRLQPPFPDNDDFQIRSQTELMERQRSVTDTMTSLLSIVAVVSLIVGGIGIMNIMLVSVTERTREIGIRKAIGATPRDILMQFLIESAIISILGGIVGIGVGIAGAIMLASVGGWNTIINTTAVVAAVVVAAGVGIFFGIYPASKAAALHPIEALRFE